MCLPSRSVPRVDSGRSAESGKERRTGDQQHQHHLPQCLSSRESPPIDDNMAFQCTSSSPLSYTTSSSPISFDGSCDPPNEALSTLRQSHRSSEKLRRQEKELLTQWSNSTYDSLCPNLSAKCFWQSVAPREAARHPCLQNAMLALAALNLSSITTGGTKSQRAYRKIATTYRSKAIDAVDTTAIAIDPSNLQALFASSSIMLIFEFAFHLTLPIDETEPLNGIQIKLQLIREIIGILEQVIKSDTEGQLTPLLDTTRIDPKMPDMSRLAILNLRRQNTLLHGSNHYHEIAVYEETIAHLENSLESLSRGGEATAIAFRWIAAVPERFLGLLEEREPFALVIFAHYAVVMHSLRDQWWVNDWGSKILRTICHHLDSHWMQRITWALDATGFPA